jgi:predicted permease
MTETILPIFGTAAGAMAKMVLLCTAGAVLVRRGIIGENVLQPLSKLTIALFLPSLLATKLGENVTVGQLRLWWLLPVSAVVYASVGFALGRVSRSLFCRTKGFERFYVASCSQGNSGYLPMILVVTICELTPEFKAIPNSKDIGLACVSLYLVGFVPTLWGCTFPYVSEHRIDRSLIPRIFNPPMVAVIIGASIGLIPPLKGLFWGGNAPLSIVADAADMLGDATIPCAMLILGGNLSKGVDGKAIDGMTVTGVAVCRLLLMPLFALLYVAFLRHTALLPNDPLVVLVLLISPSTPTALNMVVISQAAGRQEKAVANLLFWIYTISLVTLTFFVTVFLYLILHSPAS